MYKAASVLRGLACTLCVGLALLVGLSPSRAAETNLNVGRLSSDGLEVRKLTCKLQSGGLFGSMLIVAELAKQRKVLDACAAAGGAFLAEFTWQTGKPTSAAILASNQPKANGCVLDALKQTKAVVVGTCKGILLTGDKGKAEAAADKLAKKL